MLSRFRFFLTSVAIIIATAIAFMKKLYLIVPIGMVAFILHLLASNCIKKTDIEEKAFKKCMVLMSVKSFIVIVFVILLIVSLLKNP